MRVVATTSMWFQLLLSGWCEWSQRLLERVVVNTMFRYLSFAIQYPYCIEYLSNRQYIKFILSRCQFKIPIRQTNVIHIAIIYNIAIETQINKAVNISPLVEFMYLTTKRSHFPKHHWPLRPHRTFIVYANVFNKLGFLSSKIYKFAVPEPSVHL